MHGRSNQSLTLFIFFHLSLDIYDLIILIIIVIIVNILVNTIRALLYYYQEQWKKAEEVDFYLRLIMIDMMAIMVMLRTVMMLIPLIC